MTGASGSLGSVLCGVFVSAGAQICSVARRWTEQSPSQSIHLISADLSLEEGASAAVQHAVTQMGGLDVVVHAMGGFAADGPIANTSTQTWNQMLSLNLSPAFYVFRAAVPALTRGAGRLIAIGSIAGLQPTPGLGAYGVSKAALHALVQTLAEEGRAAGFTANALAPATLDTSVNRQAMPDADFSKWVAPTALAEQAVFLASQAGAAINGAVIPMRGGA